MAKKILNNGEHPLLRGMDNYLRVARYKTAEGYLKPNKKIIPDIFVTEACVDKAISFANTLFQTLQRERYQVFLGTYKDSPVSRPDFDLYEDASKIRRFKDIWSPWRSTMVDIGGATFGIKIFESLIEETAIYADGKYIRQSLYTPELQKKYKYHHTWETKKDFATGRLCLMVYSYDKWVHRWTETNSKSLEAQIPNVLQVLKKQVPDLLEVKARLKRDAEQRAKDWEESTKRWEIEREQSIIKKATDQSKEWVEKIIVAWTETVRVHDFFTSLEREINQQDDSRKAYLLERAKLAKELIGTVSPLDFLAKWEAPEEIANKIRQQRHPFY